MIEERVRAALSDAVDHLPAATAVDHGIIRAAKRRVAMTATALAVSLALLVAVGPFAMSRIQNERTDVPAAASPSPSVEDDNTSDVDAQLKAKIERLNDIHDRLTAELGRVLRIQRSAPEANKTELEQRSRRLEAEIAQIQAKLRTLLRQLDRLTQQRVGSAHTTQQIRITRASDHGPEVCHPRQVGETVIRHFGAINQGDADSAMDYVAPDQGWYSVTEGNPRDGGRHFVTRDSDELREYFDRRIAQNERIYLLEIDVAYERARDVAHVAYNLLRTADDLTDYAEEAGGKGAIDCDSGRIRVWSMGQGPTPGFVGDLCPGNPRPPKIALACARGGSHR